MTVTSNIHVGLAAWTNHTFVVGERTSNAGNAYVCIQGGTSTAAPTGTGAFISNGGTGHFMWLSAIDYTSIQDWNTGWPATLVDNLVGQLWDDGLITTVVGTPFLSTSGHTMGAFTATLTTAPGEGWRDFARDNAVPLAYNSSIGVALQLPGSAASGVYFSIGDANIIIDGLQIQDPISTTGFQTILGSVAGANLVVRNCIFDGYTTSATMVQVSGTVANCLFIDHGSHATKNFGATQNGFGVSHPLAIVNCTYINTLGNSISAAVVVNNASIANVKNCAIFGYTSPSIGIRPGDTGSGSIDHCLNDQTTLIATGFTDGGGNVNSALIASQFVDPTADFRLIRGSGCIDAGTTDTTDIPAANDLRGVARPQGSAWDIGAYEFVADGPAPQGATLMQMGVQQQEVPQGHPLPYLFAGSVWFSPARAVGSAAGSSAATVGFAGLLQLGTIFFVAEIDAALPTPAASIPREGWMSSAWGAVPWGGSIVIAGGGSATTTIQVSDMGYRTLPTDPNGPQPYPPYLATAFQINRQTLVDPTRTAAGAAWGKLSLDALDGHWDSIFDVWNTDSRQVRIWWGRKNPADSRGIRTDPSFASLNKLFVGYATPWLMSTNTLDIPIRDATYWLDRPLQPITYLGSGGYEGTIPLGSPVQVDAAAILAGGTGYGANLTFNVTVVGGVGSPAVINVTSNASGVGLKVNSIIDPGTYSTSPGTTVSTTGGTGTGLTLTLTFFTVKSPLYQVTKPKARGGTASNPIRNITPTLVDDTNFIYQYSDAAGTVVNLYEGGALTYVLQTAIGTGGDVADFYTATAPSAGHYITSNARGMFRLGSLPTSGFAITADVTGQFPTLGAISTVSEMARALMIDDLLVPSAMIDSTNFATFDTAYSYIAGVYFEAGNSLSGADAVSAILNGTALRMAPSRTGLLRLFALALVTPTTPADVSFTEVDIISVTPAQMPAVVDPPPYRIRIGYQHNYTRIGWQGILGAATNAQRQYLLMTADPSVGSVSAAVQLAYTRPNDPPQIASALLIQSQAQAVADMLIAIFSIRQRLYTVEVPFQIGIAAELGNIAFVRFPFGDLRTGLKGIIVAEQFQADQATIKYDVMIPTSGT